MTLHRPTAFFVGLLLLAGLTPAAADSLAVRVELAAETPEAREAPGEDLEVPVSVKVELPGGKRTVKSLRTPGTARFEVAAGTAVRVTASATGWWAPSRALYVDGPEEIFLHLRPTGTLYGELRVSEDSAPPTELTVRFRPAPGGPVPLEEGSLDCPLEALRFRCEVPAGVLDLRLRARGSVSHYRWGVEVPAHGEYPLGTLMLRAGASVVGWVEPPEREFRFGEVRARLEPVALGSTSGRNDLERRDILSLTARPNERGFFELPGVVPGSYVLSVEHPGYAATTISPVTVLDGAETEVRQIELSPPAELELRLDPPRHPLSHWIVELHHLSRVPGHSDRVAEGSASAEGLWAAGGLESGKYRLRILDRRGSSWADQEIEVVPGMGPARIELPMVRLEGTVTLGGEPLAASLYFGGRHGARSIVIHSNEQGKFYVFLPPEPDTWIADVVNETLHLSARVPGIEVRRLPGEPWAKVEIELPDTRIEGQVVDEAGNPVADAAVTASGESFERAATRSESPGGTFLLRALQPGRWHLHATLPGKEGTASSEVETVALEEEEGALDVRLVLRREIEVSGFVVEAGGSGVPGAWVSAFPELPVPTRRPAASTRVDGTFTVSVPAAAQGLQLTVYPPGFAVTQTRIDPRGPEPLIVPVDTVGGTVVLHYPGTDETSPSLLRFQTTLFYRFLLPSSDLLNWARAHGVEQTRPDRFVIPALPPGPYTACFSPGLAAWTTGLPPEDSGENCVRGLLPPYGQLVLELPVSSERGGTGSGP